MFTGTTYLRSKECGEHGRKVCNKLGKTVTLSPEALEEGRYVLSRCEISGV